MADRLRRQPQPNVRQVSLTDLDNQATQSGKQPVAAPAAAEPTTSKRKKANEAVKEKQSGNDEEDEEEAIHQDHLDEAAEPRQETAAKEGELETPAGPAKKKGRTANVKPPFQNASQEPLGDITSVKGCPVVLTDELRFVQSPDTELLKIRVGNVLRAYFPKAAGRNTNLILAAIPSRRRHLRQFPRPTRDGRTGARAW